MLVTFLFAVPKCLTDRHNLEGKGLCGLRFRGVNLSLSGGHGGRRSREKNAGIWLVVSFSLLLDLGPLAHKVLPPTFRVIHSSLRKAFL